jgi:hypothetical protein
MGLGDFKFDFIVGFKDGRFEAGLMASVWLVSESRWKTKKKMKTI